MNLPGIASPDRQRMAAALAAGRKLFERAAPPHRLAAAYGKGLIKAKPFEHGNLALALAVIYVILKIGGFRLIAPEAECVALMRGVESGGVDEDALSAWIKTNSEAA